MPDDLLDLVEELIRGACDGQWPLTLDGWTRITAFYGLKMHCAGEKMLFGRAASYGQAVCVYVEDERWTEILPAICHEVAECLLDFEEFPPYSTPGMLTRHQVAQLVEFRYRRFLNGRK